MHAVTLIPGDGIGPEVTDAAMRVVEASGVGITWDRVEAGLPALAAHGDPLPDAVIESIVKNRVALKGPLSSPPEFTSVNVRLRQLFVLYANIRPIKSYRGVRCLHNGVDAVIFRENIEEFYTAEERKTSEGVELTAKMTRVGCERIIRAAFAYARRNGRKRVSLAHKANILKTFYGLFLGTGQAVAREYPDIAFDDFIIDNFGQQLVMRPQRFDVVVLTNLLGDIMSDVAAGLVGGLGLAPGANIGGDYAIFEAVHGSAPDIAGKGIANPCAVILSAAMMLRHLGETVAADRIEQAIETVLAEGAHVTADIKPGSICTTREMTDAIIAKL